MKNNSSQANLFDDNSLVLPADYDPVHPDYMAVSQIYLTKGSISTPERRQFVERICHLYPEAHVIEHLDTPHNHIRLGETDAIVLHSTGKQTLVFGELKNAVRFSEEEGNTCPNYWHFSPYGFCPYGCKYCYLAGTQGVKFSPTVKVYVNLPEMLIEIDRIARRLGKPTAFYTGKLQDGLALDSLTAYSTILIPFFAEHPYARMTLLTKSTGIDRLIELEHKGHSILSWSINPPEVCRVFEENVPAIQERLEAMRRAAIAGYPVRAVIMPIIPIKEWQDVYAAFTRHLVETVPLQRLTIGGICSYKAARVLMERKLGAHNPVSTNIDDKVKSLDGRTRYSARLRQDIYYHIIRVARSVRPEIEIALCLESKELWEKVGLENNLGRCNCVL
jgi:spore photoproduct lyase